MKGGIAFWKKHSDCNEAGEQIKHGYQRILTDLAKARKAAKDAYKVDADNAIKFFGGKLNDPLAKGAFEYRKSNKKVIYTDPEKIAMKWRALLENDAEIRLLWLARTPPSM